MVTATRWQQEGPRAQATSNGDKAAWLPQLVLSRHQPALKPPTRPALAPKRADYAMGAVHVAPQLGVGARLPYPSDRLAFRGLLSACMPSSIPTRQLWLSLGLSRP